MVNELRDARLRRGLSQRELAELVGCSRSHMCAVERGLSLPGTRLRFELFRELHVSPLAYGKS